MKTKKIKNLGLNFEKITISRLKQTTVRGGANGIDGEAQAVSKPSEKSCVCHFCDFHPC